jgi:hypothetical protein
MRVTAAGISAVACFNRVGVISTSVSLPKGLDGVVASSGEPARQEPMLHSDNNSPSEVMTGVFFMNR